MTGFRTRGLGPGQRIGQEQACYYLYDIVRERLRKNDLYGLENAFSIHTNEDDAVRQLGRALFDESTFIRTKAMEKLVSLAVSGTGDILPAKPYLIRAVNDGYFSISNNAALILGIIASDTDISKAMPRLRRKLISGMLPGTGIQAALSGAVCNPITKEAAIDILCEGLGSAHENVRMQSACALQSAASTGGDISEAFTPLKLILGDSDRIIALHGTSAFASAAHNKADISIAVDALTKIVAQMGYDELHLSAITALSEFSQNGGDISSAIPVLGEVVCGAITYDTIAMSHKGRKSSIDESKGMAARALKNAASAGLDISTAVEQLVHARLDDSQTVREEVRLALLASLKNPKSNESALKTIVCKAMETDQRMRQGLYQILIDGARSGIKFDLHLVNSIFNDQIDGIRKREGKESADLAMKEASEIYLMISNTAKESKSRIFTDGEMLFGEKPKPPSGTDQGGMYRSASASRTRVSG